MSVVPKRETEYAGIAHLVERRLAKAEVAGSSPVSRSNKNEMAFGHLIFIRVKRGLSCPLERSESGFEVQIRLPKAILTIRWMVKKDLNGRPCELCSQPAPWTSRGRTQLKIG